MPNIIKGITDGLVKGIPELMKTGGNMLKGMLEGLLDMTAIGNAVKSCSTALSAVLKRNSAFTLRQRLLKKKSAKILCSPSVLGSKNTSER